MQGEKFIKNSNKAVSLLRNRSGRVGGAGDRKQSKWRFLMCTAACFAQFCQWLIRYCGQEKAIQQERIMDHIWFAAPGCYVPAGLCCWLPRREESPLPLRSGVRSPAGVAPCRGGLEPFIRITGIGCVYARCRTCFLWMLPLKKRSTNRANYYLCTTKTPHFAAVRTQVGVWPLFFSVVQDFSPIAWRRDIKVTEKLLFT